MDYFNLNHFYSTSSAREEPDAYPVLGQTSAGEVADNHNQAFGTFAHGWDMVERPGPMVDSLLTSPWAMIGHEPVASAHSYTTPYTTEDNGHDQPAYSGDYWPTAGYQAQSRNSGLSGQNFSLSCYDSFDRTMGSETSVMAPNLNSGTLDYWEGSQSGPSMSTSYGNVHQSSTGPTRTGAIQVPPPFPYVGPPTQPAGGSSETVADAAKNQPIVEEDKAPSTKQTKLPRGKGVPRPQRNQAQTDAGRVCAWVKQQKGLKPTINQALAVAARIIPKNRPLANLEPCLLTTKGRRKGVRSDRAEKESRRRDVERKLLQELSQYYPLGQRQKGWSHASLMSLIAKDLEDPSALPGPSNQPDP